jgi:hypothetical protein
MPVFRRRVALELVRNVRAFLNVEGGVTRGSIPGDAPAPNNGLSQPRQARGNRVARRPLNDTGNKSVQPESLVWIFGSGKTGSTWLSHMMADLEGYKLWAEPDVGKLFGVSYERAREGQRASKNFILGDGEEGVRARAVRSFVLESVRGRFPGVANGGKLVIKEPWGSAGAPLLVEALPESRVVLLVRDPRDTVASGFGSSGWNREGTDSNGGATPAARNPDRVIENMAEAYRRNMEGAREAYEAHRGPKSLVRYEDLRADALGNMRRICSELGLAVNDAELSRVVEKHSWESIPEEKKGEGKFHRKASTGGWRDDLTPGQARVVEEINASTLEEFYPV